MGIPVVTIGNKASQVAKNLPANIEDEDLIPGSESFPGGGNGNPLHYSCLEHPMDRRVWPGYSSSGCKESDVT